MIDRIPVGVLVLTSVLGIQFGHAFGKQLLGATGPMGMVAMRLVFAAVVLLVLVRPSPQLVREKFRLVLAFGVAIAGMSLLLFPALERLPVGLTVSLQFLGPLSVALLGSRRAPDLLWALLAGTGVFLFYDPAAAGWSTSGALFALGSGACWAAYMLFSKRAGARADSGVLALAVACAALLCLPFVPAGVRPTLLAPEVLVAGLGVAVLSAVVPYACDLAALRRIPPRVLGVLVSLEPAVGGLGGLLVLGERLAWSQWLAIALISAASLGVAATSRVAKPCVPSGSTVMHESCMNRNAPPTC